MICLINWISWFGVIYSKTIYPTLSHSFIYLLYISLFLKFIALSHSVFVFLFFFIFFFFSISLDFALCNTYALFSLFLFFLISLLLSPHDFNPFLSFLSNFSFILLSPYISLKYSNLLSLIAIVLIYFTLSDFG